MKTQYDFIIDDKNSITISVGPCELDPRCVCEATMFLYHDTKQFELRMIDLSLAVECLKEAMIAAEQNNLILHQSLRNKDIGFVFNEYMYQRYQEKDFSNKTLIVYDGDDGWVGKCHQMWGGNNIVTWIYNTSDGLIVFEAAPVYPEDFSNNDDFDHQKFYAWMKEYKPIFIRKISQETVQEWIKTADQLLRDVTWMDREGVESA